MSSLISLFRQQYPQGSLCCDLLEIDRGLYIVQASVTIDGIVLATALAANAPLEVAEDMAKERVLSTLNLSPNLSSPSEPAAVKENPVAPVTPAKKESKPVKQSSKTVTSSTSSKTSPEPKPAPAVIPPQMFTEEPPMATPEIAVVPPSFPPSPDPVPAVVEKPLPLQLENVSFYDEPEEPGYIHGIDQESFNNDQPGKINELPLPLTTETHSPSANTAPEAEASASNGSDEPMDFSEIIARSNLELKRLGWTSDQGRNYLLQTYGKRSRQLLSDEQLIEFLAYLEQQPDPK